MQFQIFTIPVADDGSAMEEMNRFLRSHKVLETEQQLLSTKNGAQWHFCIKYLANAQPDNKPQNISKIDYKEVLDEKTFAVFSVLREVRKAALDQILPNTIKKVKGIGDKKTERFGKRLERSTTQYPATGIDIAWIKYG